ncbi:MAG: prephenate dehydrogenase, partial [Vulcanimicrobiaceae bacterium]
MPSEGSLRLGILGTGLIGASIGLRARALGYHVVAVDRSPVNLRLALERGAVDEAVDALDGRELDLLVLATPLDVTLALVRRFAADPPRARLILDVASVKAPVVEAAAGLAGFVGTHPIAGGENSGPADARADLFSGAYWAYDPAAFAPARAEAVAFIERLGARPVPIEPGLHDRTVALTSHLPQLLATVLAAQVGERLGRPPTAELCGSGLASMTRLGASSWEVWGSIFSENAAPIAQEIRSIAAILSKLAADLEEGRADRLAPAFATS